MKRVNGPFTLASVGCLALLVSFTWAGEPDQTTKRPYQNLHIPELLEGTTFNLDLHRSSKSFWPGAKTQTYAYNKESFWGPTLVFNQGETVHLNVKNDLTEPTTAHWHGMHIPAKMDGGPHELIAPGSTWSPSFKVMNHAATYWYHPHVHEATQKQLTYGAGGLIIVRDPQEAALALPRTYGVDDIPLALSSRRFYTNQEFSFEGDNDKYGDFMLVNGTLDAQVSLPAEFVRFRILNVETERGYNLGFGDNRTFYVIATDGGLVDKPIPVTRLKLMTGERVEILVNLGNDKVGSSVDFGAYNANQPFGFPGGENGTTRPNGGYLNNINFRILHINVGTQTANGITSLPATLISNRFPREADVSKERTINITGGFPGTSFTFDEKGYKAHEVSQVVKLGATEKWTIQNNQVFGHSFHIHDVQVKIVSRSSGPVEDYENGWKDTMYVPRGESVSFVARFDDFESNTDAYMFHCHMSNHEDGGLMSEFLVVKDPSDTKSIVFRHQEEHAVTPEMALKAEKLAGAKTPSNTVVASNGKAYRLDGTKPSLLFFIEADCPCSRDATPFVNRLQAHFGKSCQVIGVINANKDTASAWIKTVGCSFPIVADPTLKLIGSYGAVSSVYTTVVAPGGRIEKIYPGYSQQVLKEIANRLSRLSKQPTPIINFSGAPKKLLSGCPFDIPKDSKRHLSSEILWHDR